MRKSPKQKCQQGLTLLELMVVVAIMAILMALAAPSFRKSIDNNRMLTAVNSLATGISLTRAEAIRRGAQVTMSSIGSNWASGWDIKDAGGTLIKTSGATPGLTVVEKSTLALSSLSFSARSQLTVASAKFEVKPVGWTKGKYKELRVNKSGQVSVSDK